jgi:hypothetical protein
VYFGSFGDYEEGELEGLRAKAKENPDLYMEMGDEFTSTGDIAGSVYAVDCRCNGLRKYEDFIWSHRHMILTYLCAMTKEHMTDAASELRTLTAKAVKMLTRENTMLRNRARLAQQIARTARIVARKAEYEKHTDVVTIPGRDVRRLRRAVEGRR